MRDTEVLPLMWFIVPCLHLLHICNELLKGLAPAFVEPHRFMPLSTLLVFMHCECHIFRPFFVRFNRNHCREDDQPAFGYLGG